MLPFLKSIKPQQKAKAKLCLKAVAKAKGKWAKANGMMRCPLKAKRLKPACQDVQAKTSAMRSSTYAQADRIGQYFT